MEPRGPAGRAKQTQPGERGHAIAEFAFILPLLMILILGVVDFGHLIQTRLVITNVSREGGSIGSRQTPIDSSLALMLVASGNPLKLDGPDGKIYITRIVAGKDAGSPDPSVQVRLSEGSLGASSRCGQGYANLGLTQSIYDHLVFDSDNGTADIAELTVVEVYYRYRPITPFAGFVPGVMLPNGEGVILSSKAVF